MTRLRAVYTDLDGTMLGPYGSFFADDDMLPTLEPARALVALHAADVALVLVSGRTQAQLTAAASVLGADGFVGELGAVLGWDHARRVEVLRGDMPDGVAGTPVEAMETAGLVERLGERFPGQLELHAPWHDGHVADLMLRGNVDPGDVDALCAEMGLGWLRMHDNGVLPRLAMPGTGEPVHVYHLLPGGIDKGTGVATDIARRGLGRSDVIAIGDSRSDLAMAPHVGRFYLVANGATAPATRAAAELLPNVSVTARALGLGWADAVSDALRTELG